MKEIFLILFIMLVFNAYELNAQSDSRLLFSLEEVPGLRSKIEREPFKSMFKVLEKKAAEIPESDYEHVNFASNNAFLFVLTGERKYADSALNSVMDLVNLDTWAQDDYRSLSRSMHARGVALAYDMCKNIWPYETDTFISRKLVDMGASLKRNGGKGWPSGPGNNWRAVRFGGMGLCYLAADFIPDSVREMEVNYAYEQILTWFNANLSEEAEAMGWNPEGIGYTIYPAEFWALFNLATGRSYPEKNFLNENIAAGHTLTTIYRGSILMHASPEHKGYHPDFSDDNMGLNGSGVYGLAFRNVNENYLPAMKWFYDHLSGNQGDRSFDPDRAGVIYSILYYPEDISSTNPEDIFGLNYVDPPHGMVIFRNKYQDSTDIIAQHNAKGRAPQHCHGGADANGIRIWGLGACWTTGAGRIGGMGSPGQTTVLRYDPDEEVPKSGETGKLVNYEFFNNGSGYSVIEGSSTLLPYHRRIFFADYSGLSGSNGLFIISDSTVYGKYWRLNTPEVNNISYTDSSFTITAPNGNRMIGWILHGDRGSFRTGSFTRGSGFNWNGQYYEENKWIDFESADRNYLVALLILEKDQAIPEIKKIETEDHVYIIAGERAIEMQGTNLRLLEKNELRMLLGEEKHICRADPFIRIFPNPASNSVNFDFSTGTSKLDKAQIYDFKGVMIHDLIKGFIPSEHRIIEWSPGRGKGIYFMKYHFKNGSYGQNPFIVI